jgi:hypothetical protein
VLESTPEHPYVCSCAKTCKHTPKHKSVCPFSKKTHKKAIRLFVHAHKHTNTLHSIGLLPVLSYILKNTQTHSVLPVCLSTLETTQTRARAADWCLRSYLSLRKNTPTHARALAFCLCDQPCSETMQTHQSTGPVCLCMLATTQSHARAVACRLCYHSWAKISKHTPEH